MESVEATAARKNIARSVVVNFDAVIRIEGIFLSGLMIGLKFQLVSVCELFNVFTIMLSSLLTDFLTI